MSCNQVNVVAVESSKTCKWSITWIPSARMWRPYRFAALDIKAYLNEMW